MPTHDKWKALKLKRLFANDPVIFVEKILGVKLWDRQADVLRALVDNREVAVKSCHSAGKSFLAACAALWFLYTFPGSLVLTTAPTDRQVRGILWKEITTLHRKALEKLGGDVLTKEIKLRTDWFAMGFTAPEYDPDRFQGFHAEHLLFIVDEAAGVSPKIYEAVESITTGAHSRLLLIGNPTDGTGDFGKAFRRTDVHKETISVFDTPNFTHFGVTIDDIRQKKWRDKTGRTPRYPFPTLATPEWVASRHEKWGEDSPMWQARVIAQFPDQDDGSLVPLSWIEGANKRWEEVDEIDSWSGDGVAGLDVARMGSGSTVMAVSHDQGIRQMHKRRSMLTTQTTAWVNGILKDDDSIWSVRVDGDGLGAGVHDQLKEDHGDRIVEMRGGMSAADKEHYFNARSEWFWNLRKELDPTQGTPIALPHDEELMAQLSSIRWAYTPKGMIKVESKDEMRNRGMLSPDEADAVAYARAPLGDKVDISIDVNFGRRSSAGDLPHDGPLE